MLHYTIQIVFVPQFNEHCLMIVDEKTGRYLNEKQYEQWVQLVGGVQK